MGFKYLTEWTAHQVLQVKVEEPCHFCSIIQITSVRISNIHMLHCNANVKMWTPQNQIEKFFYVKDIILKV